MEPSDVVAASASTMKASVNNASPQGSRLLRRIADAPSPAAAQVVVIHCRQVVMDQGIAVNHFDCSGNAQRTAARHTKQVATAQTKTGVTACHHRARHTHRFHKRLQTQKRARASDQAGVTAVAVFFQRRLK